MQIERNQCLIDLPDGWTQTDPENLDYFESLDGTKGVYITAHKKGDLPEEKELAKFVIALERSNTEKMDGRKFETKLEKFGIQDGFSTGFIDQFDDKNNYRIACKCFVKQDKIFRLAFHDYECLEYQKSLNAFAPIIESFKFNPKYRWAIGFDVESSCFEEAIVRGDDGFVDIDFYISAYDLREDGSILVSVRNQLTNLHVEFSILFDCEWESKDIPDSNVPFYWGNATFVNVGENSENFLKGLANLYGIPVYPCTSRKISARVVGLGNDPKEMATKDTNMKFFFNSDSEDDGLYSEVFVNVNISKRWLQFHEKDAEYREPLIRSLCGET
jgi:hypothetical protein